MLDCDFAPQWEPATYDPWELLGELEFGKEITVITKDPEADSREIVLVRPSMFGEVKHNPPIAKLHRQRGRGWIKLSSGWTEVQAPTPDAIWILKEDGFHVEQRLINMLYRLKETKKTVMVRVLWRCSTPK